MTVYYFVTSALTALATFQRTVQTQGGPTNRTLEDWRRDFLKHWKLESTTMEKTNGQSRSNEG